MMRRFTRQGAALFALLSLSQTVMAASITYEFANYPNLQNGWDLSGTITTDGTIGTLQPSDITSWTWTITSSGTSHTYTSTDPGAYLQEYGIVATGGTSMLIVPVGVDCNLAFLTDQAALADGRFFTTTFPPGPAQNEIGTQAGTFPDFNNYWEFIGNTPPYTDSDFVIATAVVPEPCTLYLLGLGAACGSVYLTGRKRRPRTTATTA